MSVRRKSKRSCTPTSSSSRKKKKGIDFEELKRITEEENKDLFRLDFKKYPPCRKEDHLKKKNCAANPHCLYGLGENDQGIWAAHPPMLDQLGPDPFVEKREKDQPCGLKNLGATCYLNSLIQCLFHNHAFRAGIYKCRQETFAGSEHDKQLKVVHELQRLFGRMQMGNRKAADPARFVEELRLDHSIQQDPQELNKLFLALLEGVFARSGESQLKELLPSLFRGTQQYLTKCMNCNQENGSHSDFYELEIQVRGHSSVEDSLQTYLRAELLTGDNRYLCESCGTKQEAERRVKLVTLPKVLTVQLLRYIYDQKTFAKKKLKNSISIPESLDMGNHVERNDETYSLKAVLYHKGSSAYGGHYVAEVFDNASQKFWVFDDDNVSLYTPKAEQEVKKDSANDKPKPVPVDSLQTLKDPTTCNPKRRGRRKKATSQEQEDPDCKSGGFKECKESTSDECDSQKINVGRTRIIYTQMGSSKRTCTKNVRKGTVTKKKHNENQYTVEFDDGGKPSTKTFSEEELLPLIIGDQDKSSSEQRRNVNAKPESENKEGSSEVEAIEVEDIDGKRASRDAYMLVFHRQMDVGAEMPPEVPPDVCATVREENQKLEAEIVAYNADKAKLLNAIEERKRMYERFFHTSDETDESDLNNANAVVFENGLHYYWVETEWLRSWIVGQQAEASRTASDSTIVIDLEQEGKGNDGTQSSTGQPTLFNKKMMHEKFLCPHGGLSPESVPNLKMISVKFYMKLKEKYGADLDLFGIYKNCSDCSREYSKIRHSAVLHTETHQNIIEELEQSEPQNQTEADRLTNFFIAKSWITAFKHKYRKSSKQSNVETLLEEQNTKNPKPLDEKVNQAITCEHGALSTNKSKRRVIECEIWTKIKSLYAEAIEYNAGTPVCRECQAAEQDSSEQKKKGKEERSAHITSGGKEIETLAKRKPARWHPNALTKMSWLDADKKQELNGKRFYIINSGWLRKWQSYVCDSKCTSEKPTELPQPGKDPILCDQHGLLKLPIYMDNYLRGCKIQDTPMFDYEIINQEQWEFFQKQFGEGLQISLKYENDHWEFDPVLDKECMKKHAQLLEDQEINFEKMPIKVVKLRTGQDPPKCEDDGQRRMRPKRYGKCEELEFSSTQNLFETKLLVSQFFDVDPKDVQLYLDGRRLCLLQENLKANGVKSTSTLYLKLEEGHDEDPYTFLGRTDSLTTEVGFMGTLLSAGRAQSESGSINNCTANDRDAASESVNSFVMSQDQIMAETEVVDTDPDVIAAIEESLKEQQSRNKSEEFGGATTANTSYQSLKDVVKKPSQEASTGQGEAETCLEFPKDDTANMQQLRTEDIMVRELQAQDELSIKQAMEESQKEAFRTAQASPLQPRKGEPTMDPHSDNASVQLCDTTLHLHSLDGATIQRVYEESQEDMCYKQVLEMSRKDFEVKRRMESELEKASVKSLDTAFETQSSDHKTVTIESVNDLNPEKSDVLSKTDSQTQSSQSIFSGTTNEEKNLKNTDFKDFGLDSKDSEDDNSGGTRSLSPENCKNVAPMGPKLSVDSSTFALPGGFCETSIVKTDPPQDRIISKSANSKDMPCEVECRHCKTINRIRESKFLCISCRKDIFEKNISPKKDSPNVKQSKDIDEHMNPTKDSTSVEKDSKELWYYEHEAGNQDDSNDPNSQTENGQQSNVKQKRKMSESQKSKKKEIISGQQSNTRQKRKMPESQKSKKEEFIVECPNCNHQEIVKSDRKFKCSKCKGMLYEDGFIDISLESKKEQEEILKNIAQSPEKRMRSRPPKSKETQTNEDTIFITGICSNCGENFEESTGCFESGKNSFCQICTQNKREMIK